ncbi:MAG: carboxypeptidase-like regulatory domain-containing protein [Bacteroidetes bacterium]|nr:carboxypeptidase-like regulatory domain-containing protein [Bacteroidota bacterium]
MNRTMKPQNCLKNSILLPVLVLASLVSFSQTRIQGSVKDAETSDELPWCSISVKGAGKGAITNIEGTFAISVNLQEDTLLFSYVGYKAIEVPASVVSQKKTVLLERAGIQLEELTVHADNDYLYEILDHCRKKIMKNKRYQVAKVYYGIETQTEEQPIELLECYYNGYLEGLTIKSLLFRNGRIGLAELDQRYFLTLNSSMAISQVDLVRQNADYPSIPMQFTKKSLKKIFRLTMEPGENGMYHIGFQPWQDIHNHFSGEIWIDRKTYALVKIDLAISNAARHPFIPIFKIDRLSNVDIKISHTFKNDGFSNSPDYINFSYHVTYKSARDDPGSMTPSVIQREIDTRGVLCFYDYDDPFIIPRFDYDANYDDYRKMSIIPFNEFFWDNNNTLILTEKQKESIGFFADNGLLVNFEKGSYGKDFLTLTHYDSSLYENFYTFWDPVKRFSLNRNLPQNKIYKQSEINRNILTDKYNLHHLEVQLLLDVTSVDNTFFCKSYAVFDEKKTYFHLPDEPETTTFLNIFFDLCEIERRKMEQALNTSAFTAKQIDSVYKSHLGNMKKITTKYLDEAKLGKSKRAMSKWNSEVLEILGIDNMKMFQEKEEK